MKKLSCLILSILMLFVCTFGFTAYGANTQKITVDYSVNSEKLAGAVFHIYRLGEVKGHRIIPNSTFNSYGVNFDVSDTEKMNSLALALSAYILRDNIKPDYTDVSDKNGTVDFDGIAFEEGAYLIVADKHRQNECTYFCDPLIVILPYGNEDEVKVKPKCEGVPDDTEKDTATYKVLKAWIETDGGTKRPAEIVVELLRDGELYDTVILNESNNWRFQWDDLSVFNHWTVIEKTVIDGYVVSLSRFDKTFLLTNTEKGDEPEDTTAPDETTTSPEDTTTAESTTQGDTTTTEVTTNPDTTTTEGTTDPFTTTAHGTTKPDSTTSSGTTNKPEKEPELPVTGVLRWPVPYLAMIGVFLFIIGYAKYRKSELENE